MKKIKVFIKLIVLYSGIGLLALLIIPSDPKNAWFFGYSTNRVILISIFLTTIFFLVTLMISLGTNNKIDKVLKQIIFVLKNNKNIRTLLFLIVFFLILFSFVFLLVWFLFQKHSAIFLRLSPLCFLSLASGMLALNMGVSKYNTQFTKMKDYISDTQILSKRHRILSFFVYSLIFIFFGVYFYWGTVHADLVNNNMGHTDQSAYMSFAKQARDTHFEYRGGRNRMPIYPYLLALLYKEDISDDDFFDDGKLFNIRLSLILLLCWFTVKWNFLSTTIRKGHGDN